MALFGRKRTTVALDIGSGLIKLVVIDHGGGWETQSCHLARGSIRVKVGQAVAAGQPIARAIVSRARNGSPPKKESESSSPSGARSRSIFWSCRGATGSRDWRRFAGRCWWRMRTGTSARGVVR